uniref:Uncharacterized protein n=1 Tax=Phyllymenia taiwanensis TaxID=1260292 RepID=R9XYC3_9FLOR|nr:hypothetical protein [Grateloupia taiwanensis]AGO19780.1 hypothetical protein [Grateloupia taiwanensis]
MLDYTYINYRLLLMIFEIYINYILLIFKYVLIVI